VAAFFAISPTRAIEIAEVGDESILDSKFASAKAKREEPRAIFALNAKRVNKVFFESVWKELGIDLENTINKTLRPLGDEDDPSMGHFLPERIAEQLFPADAEIRAKCRWAFDCAECDVAQIISPLSGENRRLISQRGLFTKMSRWQPLEDWVAEYFSEPPGGKHCDNERILLKVEIPESEREIALQHLDAANINHLTLFPDLEGAARYSNGKIG
jgi:hypothetical protein